MESSQIYSKIEYADAVSAKRDLLTTQMSILNLIKRIENYKKLRKKELMLKIKLRNTLKEIREGLIKIIKSAPETEGIKHLEKIRKEFNTNHENKRVISIESELREIREKLEKLG